MPLEIQPPTTIDEAQPIVRPRLRACQVGGIPAVHVVDLMPIKLSVGVLPCLNEATALYVGTTVQQSGYIAYLSPVIPKLQFKAIRVVVEFTDVDHQPDETLCKFTLRYLDQRGACNAQVTGDLMACGDKFGWWVPAHHIKQEMVFPLTIMVELRSPFEHVDATGALRSHRPILIRGAWLEFPE